MKLIFTKGAAKHDTLEVLRPGMPAERVQCPKQRIIPHDMVHYAVEHTLQARGFLGRVKDGERAVLAMAPDDESAAVERLVEVFQGDEWSGGGSSTADIIDLYRVTCQARSCTPLPLDGVAIAAVKSAIADLTHRWQATPIGGAMVLDL